jgi:hypothetical protein
MRSARSIVLGVVSMCGSLAAVVWLATSGIASAETLSLEAPPPPPIEAEIHKDKVVTTKKLIVEKEKPAPKKKKPRIDFGAFEGY